MAILSGNVIFDGGSINFLSSGDIYGSGIFCTTSSNAGSIVSGYFFGSSVNKGTVLNATFSDYATNSGITVYSAKFANWSKNCGLTYGSALFANTATNYGIIYGSSGVLIDPQSTNYTQMGSYICRESLTEKYTLPKSYDQYSVNLADSVNINKHGDTIAFKLLCGVLPYPNCAATDIYVFCWNGSSWVERGDRICRNTYKLCMNGCGDIIASALPCANGYKGRIATYCWNNSTWNQMGSDITESESYQLGSSFSMNCVGDIIAAKERTNINIYCFQNSSWSKISTIEPTENLNPLEMAMSSDGSVIATLVSPPISPYDPGNFNPPICTGIIKIYCKNGSTWSQMGSTITNQYVYREHMNPLAIAGNGDKVFVGYPVGESYQTGSGVIVPLQTGRGVVVGYHWDGSSWNKTAEILEISGSDINRFGYEISTDLIGAKLAISAVPNYYVTGNPPQGYVNIYNCDSSNSTWSLCSQIKGTGWRNWQSVGYYGNTWVETGDFVDNAFGQSMKMSISGTHVVVASPRAATGLNRTYAGVVSVYRLNQD
jgi:hypothetical protein